MKFSLLAPAAAVAMIAAPVFAAKTETTTTTTSKVKPAKHAKAHMKKVSTTTSTSK